MGAVVEIDQEAAGHAPLEQRLPIGTHRITVTDPETKETLLSDSIHIEGHHTRQSPFRILR